MLQIMQRYCLTYYFVKTYLIFLFTIHTRVMCTIKFKLHMIIRRDKINICKSKNFFYK